MISNITLDSSMYTYVHQNKCEVDCSRGRKTEQVQRSCTRTTEQVNCFSLADASEYVDCCTSAIDVAQTIGPTHF